MRRSRVMTGVAVAGIILGGLGFYATRRPTSPEFQIGSPLPRGRVQPHLISIDDQAILLAPDGSLWAWGGRQFQLRSVLGRPTITDRPIRIGNDSDWIKVAATWSRTLAIKSDGSLWGWGYNHNRQMANIATNYLGRPTRIGLDSDWSKISVGAGHCLALKKGGTLWAWGQNDHGQVGVGTTNSPTGPAQVDGELDWRAISAGAFNSYALMKDGSIWGWGADPISGGSRDDLEPNRVNSGRDWAAIAAGDFHLLALRTDGTIWIRGQNAGIVAPGFVKGSTAEFVEVGSDTNWAEIYSGSGYFFARQRDGSWWASGTNNRIQFGFSPISAALKSEPSGLSLEPWAIASGNSTTLLLAQDGSLWSWGIRLGVPAHDPRFEKLIRFANSVRARVNRGQVLFPERAEPTDSKPYRVWMLPDSMRRQLQADASTTWPRRK